MTTANQYKENPNPFSAAKPGIFVTQDVKTCDICAREGTDASYTLMVSYAGQWRIAKTVCPDCMQRLGFEPRVCIPMDKYEQMLDTIALATNMRNQALIKEAEKKERES